MMLKNQINSDTQTKHKYYISNYKSRKVYLLISTLFLIICIVLMAIHTYNFKIRINDEIKFLTRTDDISSLTPQALEKALKISETYQLLHIYRALYSVLAVLNSLTLIFAVITQSLLYLHYNNGRKFFKFMIAFSVISFVVIFFIVALQPQAIQRTGSSYIDETTGEKVYEIERMQDFSYIIPWITMFLCFFTMVFLIIAKGKYGHIEKDFKLKKQLYNNENSKVIFNHFLVRK
ncbi:hypothetical protein V2E24_01675 [Mycoplasmopsis ciconiae]|uniref:Uncharacterized protein n=1 Tax=Mycoplasmopsis ciconiae TaxID=561067 RepID=A0ABU7ML70_9BACT|nr:hypothetical protein [Mycoplasmopsis ciconiae]